MDIGILGSGNMGAALGKRWAAKGHQIIFSFSRDQTKLQRLAREAGDSARAGSVVEAVDASDVLMLAVPADQLDAVLGEAGSLAGKILITCVSGLRPDFTGQTIGLATDLSTSIAEQIAQRVPGARVVEAFNSTFAELVAADSPRFGADRPSVFYCGDDATAKQTVVTLIEDCDYDAVDAGLLVVARSLETLSSAWVQLAAASQLFPGLGLKVLRR